MKVIERTQKTCTASAAGRLGESLAARQFSSAQDLKLEFRQVPLQIVLNYLSDAAGVVINAQPNVALNRAVDLWRDEPVDSQEAISLLRRSLGAQDCAVLQRGRVLKIMKNKDLKKSRMPLPCIAVNASSDPDFAGKPR